MVLPRRDAPDVGADAVVHGIAFVDEFFHFFRHADRDAVRCEAVALLDGRAVLLPRSIYFLRVLPSLPQPFQFPQGTRVLHRGIMCASEVAREKVRLRRQIHVHLFAHDDVVSVIVSSALFFF